MGDPSTETVHRTIRFCRHMLAGFVAINAVSGAEASAESAAAALSHYHQGNYERALALLQPCARDGDPDCQFALGTLYENGFAIEPDEYQAFRWIERAAHQGQAAAQLTLGMMYARGEGVTSDYDLAFTWVKRAADQGHTGAKLVYRQLLDNWVDEGC